MTEINRPSPIKPIWPARRDESANKRKRPDEEEKEKQDPVYKKRPGKDQQPSIDEYV